MEEGTIKPVPVPVYRYNSGMQFHDYLLAAGSSTNKTNASGTSPRVILSFTINFLVPSLIRTHAVVFAMMAELVFLESRGPQAPGEPQLLHVVAPLLRILPLRLHLAV